MRGCCALGAQSEREKMSTEHARRELPRFFFQGLAGFMMPGVSTANVAAHFEACLEFGQR